MREICAEVITALVERLCIEAATVLPEDMCHVIEDARRMEESPVGQSILEDIHDNYVLARERGVPICQDTGMAVVFLELGQEVHVVGGDLNEAIHEGVRRGYLNGHLRCSVVSDPLERINTGDNTPAVIHTTIVPGEKIRITVAPKGFGSENMSAMKLFTPAATWENVEAFIISQVEQSGSNPCPPVVVGVGLGGTIEQCALEAKKALLMPMDKPNENAHYAQREESLLHKINALGIGPQGMGGRITALAVHIRPYATHIAGLPCVVNMSCHATRHACGEI